MQKFAARPLVKLLDRMALRLWAKRLKRAQSAGPYALQKLRTRLRPLKTLLDATDRLTTKRLSNGSPQISSLPPRTNWSWHPEISLSALAGGPVASGSTLAPALRFFHDANVAEIGLQQTPGNAERNGITADIYEFDGTYISFALTLPPEALTGLQQNDLFRVELDVIAEQPVEISVRLNLRHGPNLEKIVRRIDLAQSEREVEFDISYTAFDAERGRDIWIDIIFHRPRMNRIEIRDVLVLRRSRAEV